jgi:hypothetical protein
MNDLLPRAVEQQVYARADRQFVDYLEQFQLNLKAVERIEQYLAKLALAANLAASRPSNNNIQTDEGTVWHKNANLMTNIYFCHRPVEQWTEYAAVEYFPSQLTNEIWNRGQNAVQVLTFFVKEQREALKMCSGDLSAQVEKFLADKYSNLDVSRLADRSMRLHIHAVTAQPCQP